MQVTNGTEALLSEWGLDMNAVAIYGKPVVQPRKIRGWLMLPYIGVILTPLIMMTTLLFAFIPIFGSDTWAALTSSSGDYYLPYTAVLLVIEFLGGLALLTASSYLLVLFTQKRSNLPNWYAGVTVFSLVYLIADTFVGSYIVGVTFLDAKTIPNTPQYVPLILGLLIWVPYLYRSQRSKETFIL